MQLVIPLSDHGGPLYRQVYLGLRQAILSGALPTNGRLPSTRDLADQLGISRTVVLLATTSYWLRVLQPAAAAQEHT
jgi:GntR family transcriptional regulator/MocR family aminotransferase